MLTIQGLKAGPLRPLDLTLEAGECLIVQGPSGSGKSLLLRALADLDLNEGEVALAGAARSGMPAPAWRRRVVYLATDSGWWGSTVGEHFQDWQAILPELPALGLPTDCRTWPITRLSTGERQRLALLRALALQPAVLLLDEPTSALDQDMTLAVEALIERKREKGLSVIWVTHSEEQARRLGGRRLLIRNGEVVEA